MTGLHAARSLSVAWVLGLGGMGTAVAANLLVDHTVVGVDRKSRSLDEMTVAQVDLSADSAVQALVDLANEHGVPSKVAICAGLVSALGVDDATEYALQEVVSHNLGVVVNALRAIRRLGTPVKVVVVTSNAAFVPRPSQPIYAATKAAIVSIISSSAVGFASSGVRVVGLAPGTVMVERNQERIREQYPAAPAAPDRPGGRIALPEDVAAFARSLFDHADLLTGRTLTFDGGSTLQS